MVSERPPRTWTERANGRDAHDHTAALRDPQASTETFYVVWEEGVEPAVKLAVE